MPRAKVRDEDRQRSRKACVPCKSSKIRCDANEPCSNCIRKNRKAACQYLTSSSTRKEQPPRPSKIPRRSSDHTHPASVESSELHGLNEDDVLEHRKSDATHPLRSVSTQGKSAPSPEVTHSRLLLSSKGEKMYIGNYSHLSLLHFLRQTVRLHVGSSAFSEAAAMNTMLEADVSESDDIDIDRETYQYKETLVQCFLEVSAGLLDVCTEGEIYNLLSITSGGIQTYAIGSEHRAVLYLIMAIGGQCLGHKLSDLRFAATCFSKARKLAFEGLLCDPSINMVRIFILLAFYMLGACRRNAAYMYLGVASRAACALGLHTKSHHPNLSRFEIELRLRIWRSLYVLDTLTSLLLGRPGSLSIVKLNPPEQGGPKKDQHPKTKPIDAAYGACIHIANIFPTVSQSTDLDPGSTEAFLESLGRWRETALPSNRRYTFGLASLPALETLEQQTGELHVACIYYFGVILVTKPFLLSHLTNKLRQQTTGKNDTQSLNESGDERIGKLAQACVDASCYMTQLSKSVMDSGGLKDNMVILLAFMFSAGLLLGYSNFVDGKAGDGEEAFQAAQAVLKKLSTLSPQARHYHEILRDFDSATTKYHHQQQEKRRKSTGRYVKPMFSIDTEYDASSTAYPTPSSGMSYPNLNSGQPSTIQDNSAYTRGIDFMDMGSVDIDGSMIYASGGTSNAGNNDVPLFWDEDNFDWQLFSAFPDEVHIGM